MIALVSVEAGHLRRYGCEHGQSAFLTHEADVDEAATEDLRTIVESFRASPPFCFHISYESSLEATPGPALPPQAPEAA